MNGPGWMKGLSDEEIAEVREAERDIESCEAEQEPEEQEDE